MKPFAFLEPATVAEAIEMLANGAGSARLIAGGSDLLGEMKEGIVHYDRLVSLGRIAELGAIREEPGGLFIGAAVTLADMEHEPLLSGPYGVLAEAARGIATPEIRNQGTVGGNLCQRPRCFHYRSAWIPCLKKGGAGCPARESAHQHYLSVFEGGECAAASVSDLAPALVALGASAVVEGAGGQRRIPLREFRIPLRDYRGGAVADPPRENILAPDEVLTGVALPSAPEGWRGCSLKARERTAGDFALVSAVFGCRVLEGKMRGVRLVLGAAAASPLACPDAEGVLEGAAFSPALAAEAAEAAFADAKPIAHNGYKVAMGRALVARAIEQIAG